MRDHLWRNLWRRVFYEKQFCHANQYLIIRIGNGGALVLTSRLKSPACAARLDRLAVRLGRPANS
jgi:hypothetical protein